MSGPLSEAAKKEVDRILSAEQQSPEKVNVTVDATPQGVEAEASVNIGAHATAGGFFSRSWQGVKSWGARFRFSR